MQNALPMEIPIQDSDAMSVPQKERRRALIVPREHGAWGMLLVPLLTGATVGIFNGGRLTPVLLLTMAVLAVFWLRTPLESWLGTNAVRAQTSRERQLVRKVVLPLAGIATLSVLGLFWRGQNLQLGWLGVIAGVAFAVQLLLKRMGRKMRMAAEVVGAIALTATAPAAYCVVTGRLDTTAWTLWMANWLFAADQVHFVWLSIRGARATHLSEKLEAGGGFLAGQTLLVIVLTLAYYFGWLPGLTLIAFAPVLLRGLLWFVRKPQPVVVRRLGWTEFAQALVFGALLTASFCVAV
jgi:hypothetical protein